MNILFPVFAAILQASSVTLDKIILSIRRVTFRTYTGISFPLVFIITAIIFLIYQPPLNLALFQNFGWLMIIGLAAIIIVTNLIFYRALQYDKLVEIETIDLLRNIPIILFTGIIFASERNFNIIAPALIASFAIIWSHWQRHHFALAKNTWPFLIWTLTVAPIRAAMYKIMLVSWNPISLELVITFITAVVIGSIYYKHANEASSKAWLFLIATNIFTSIAWILYYFSYQKSGVVYTILLFSLQPLLVYFAALVLLKEQVQWRKIFAFFVVLASIAVAQILNSLQK